MASLFSTFTEVGLIDTRNNAGTITLPATTNIPFRTITLKDIYGNFSKKSLTLSTQSGDSFEDGTTTKTFSNDYGFVQIYAGGNNRWYFLNGTTITAQTVSSLTVSTIVGDGSSLRNLPAISTLSLQSTIAGLGTAGYISASQLYSTVSGIGSGFTGSTLALSAGTITAGAITAALVSTLNLNVSTINGQTFGGPINSTMIGLGTAGYISASQLYSTVSGIGSGFTGSTLALSAGTITAGAITAALVSTLNLNVSTINGQTFGGPINSTMIGLGTAGYISASQLYSTVTGIGQGFTGSTLALSAGTVTASLVSTLGLNVCTINGQIFDGKSFLNISTGFINASNISANTITGRFNGDGSLLTNLTIPGLTYMSPQYAQFTVSSGQSYISSPWANQNLVLSTLSMLQAPVILNPDGYSLRISTSITKPFRVSYMCGGNQDSGGVNRPTITLAVSSATGVTYYPTVNSQEIAGASISFIESFNTSMTLFFVQRCLSNYTYKSADTTSYRIAFETIQGTSIDIFSTNNVWSATNRFISAPVLQNGLGMYDTGTVSYRILTLSSSALFVDGTIITAGGGGGGGGGIQISDLTSTIAGLGTAGYISSSQLFSTVTGIGTGGGGGGIQTSNLTSTVVGLGTTGYISTQTLFVSLTSTVTGLANQPRVAVFYDL